MNDLIIAATQYTPEVLMHTKGHISIKGKSYPENTLEFYRPVVAWISEWIVTNPTSDLSIEFDIIYFNSSSSKVLFELFDLLNEAHETRSLQVVWFYDVDNENALEAGEDFSADFPALDICLSAKKP